MTDEGTRTERVDEVERGGIPRLVEYECLPISERELTEPTRLKAYMEDWATQGWIYRGRLGNSIVMERPTEHGLAIFGHPQVLVGSYDEATEIVAPGNDT